MNLVRFIENRFQEKKAEEQVYTAQDEYMPWLDAEIKALHKVLTGYRTIMVWLNLPLVLFRFGLMKVGLMAEPQPVLVNRLRAERDKKMRNKIGANDTKKEVAQEPPGNA